MDDTKPGGEKRFTPEFIFAALLAFILIPLYIYCLPPVLPPYRDSGEMAAAAWTLGVAHQPGYPLYIISAKLFSLIPLGNPAWRLNLFSALAGLGGVLVFWRLAAGAFSPLAAFFAALLLGFNFTLRTVSSVPEMYALNFLFAAILLVSASLKGARAIMLTAFLLGLGMANRMDLLLSAPALLILLWPSLREGGWRALAKSAGFFFLGFSLYLYLPFRSSGWPLFDWSHPADLKTFLAVITRKSYGSTLDLISLNYAPGELFLPNLKYYAAHLWQNFSLGLAFAAAGIWAEWRSDRRRLLGFAALFIFPGPVFLFLANMPPNPHALAIVEPYYLLPDLAAAFWTASGFFYLVKRLPAAVPGLVIAAAAASALVFYNGAHGSARRWLFAAEDYASDVMRGAPPGSAIVAKKDVQLFSLWYLQTVRGVRPDLNLVAQGLSGSPWYRATKKRYSPGLTLFNLNSGDESEWRKFAAANPAGLYSTMDADLPRAIRPTPYGALNLLSPEARTPEASPWLFYSFPRLDRDYRDFFDRDIGTSYAQAFLSGAIRRSAGPGLDAQALRELRLASLLDANLPDAPLYEGFYYSSRGDWPAARDCFRASADTYERLLLLSVQYYSLPSLRESLASASAYAWLNYGVALEKIGDKAAAGEAYAFALTRNPGMADAHYNLAILNWNRDWEKVRYELAETVRLNPSHSQARRYLEQLKAR
jgi:tetratricopeptide (TPR) repeat protein